MEGCHADKATWLLLYDGAADHTSFLYKLSWLAEPCVEPPILSQAQLGVYLKGSLQGNAALFKPPIMIHNIMLRRPRRPQRNMLHTQ